MITYAHNLHNYEYRFGPSRKFANPPPCILVHLFVVFFSVSTRWPKICMALTSSDSVILQIIIIVSFFLARRRHLATPGQITWTTAWLKFIWIELCMQIRLINFNVAFAPIQTRGKLIKQSALNYKRYWKPRLLFTFSSMVPFLKLVNQFSKIMLLKWFRSIIATIANHVGKQYNPLFYIYIYFLNLLVGRVINAISEAISDGQFDREAKAANYKSTPVSWNRNETGAHIYTQTTMITIIN